MRTVRGTTDADLDVEIDLALDARRSTGEHPGADRGLLLGRERDVAALHRPVAFRRCTRSRCVAGPRLRLVAPDGRASVRCRSRAVRLRLLRRSFARRSPLRLRILSICWAHRLFGLLLGVCAASAPFVLLRPLAAPALAVLRRGLVPGRRRRCAAAAPAPPCSADVAGRRCGRGTAAAPRGRRVALNATVEPAASARLPRKSAMSFSLFLSLGGLRPSPTVPERNMGHRRSANCAVTPRNM